MIALHITICACEKRLFRFRKISLRIREYSYVGNKRMLVFRDYIKKMYSFCYMWWSFPYLQILLYRAKYTTMYM